MSGQRRHRRRRAARKPRSPSPGLTKDERRMQYLERFQSPRDVNKDILSHVFRKDRTRCRSHRGRKANCRDNPYCLEALGANEGPVFDEDALRSLLQSQHKALHRQPSLRHDTPFAGLRNLGATCYMNTLLQSLFLNRAFRRAVFQWKPDGDSDDADEGDSVMLELQYLFARLQSSVLSEINPKPLTDLLGIKTSIQQDVQEFCQLFLSYVEMQFNSCGVDALNGRLRYLFGGETTFVTKCSHCSFQSRHRDHFYDLSVNISGHSTLDECLTDYIASEELCDDNQYMCSDCKGFQDATRSTQLTRLPQYLHVQLMRFRYDVQAETKRKVKAVIDIPHELDMSPYVTIDPRDRDNDGGGGEGDDVDVLQYELVAVLVHVGQTAYGGHYISHVKDGETCEWFRFNDEDVTRIEPEAAGMEGADLDHILNPKKRTKRGPGSSNAYMVVYARKDRLHVSDAECVPPPRVSQTIEEENALTSDAHSQFNAVFEAEQKRMSGIREEYKDFVAACDASRAHPYHWISTEWLRKWLRGEVIPATHEEPIVTSEFLVNGQSSSQSHDDDDDGDVEVDDEDDEEDAVTSSPSKGLMGTVWTGVSRLLNVVSPSSSAMDCEEDDDEDGDDGEGVDDDGDKDMHSAKPKVNGKSDVHQGSGKRDVDDGDDADDDDDDTVVVTDEVDQQKHVIDVDRDADDDDTEPQQPLEDTKVIGITNRELVCIHGGVDANHIADMKAIPSAAWEVLFEAYKGGPVLPQSLECHDCVYHLVKRELQELRRHMSRMQLRRASNPAHVAKKKAVRDGEFYWICANWIDEWRSRPKTKKEENLSVLVNDTIQCEHGQLTPDEDLRRKIPVDVWEFISGRIPTAIEFGSNAQVCSSCASVLNQKLDLYAERGLRRKEEKSHFHALYSAVNDSRRRISLVGSGPFAVISMAWARPWADSMDDQSLPDVEGPIRNDDLICERHEGALVDVGKECRKPAAHRALVLVPMRTWDALNDRFGCSHVIMVQLEHRGVNGGDPLLLSTPQFCEECSQQRAHCLRQQRLNFEKRVLTIRRRGNHEGVRKASRAYKSPIEVTVSSTDTVNMLKMCIFKETDVEPFLQRLVLDNDEKTVLTDITLPLIAYEVDPVKPILFYQERVADFVDLDEDSVIESQFGGGRGRGGGGREEAFEGSQLWRTTNPSAKKGEPRGSDDDHADETSGDDAEDVNDDDLDDDTSRSDRSSVSRMQHSSSSVDDHGNGMKGQQQQQQQQQRGHNHDDDDDAETGEVADDSDSSEAWSCPRCTYRNPNKADLCEMCEEGRRSIRKKARRR